MLDATTKQLASEGRNFAALAHSVMAWGLIASARPAARKFSGRRSGPFILVTVHLIAAIMFVGAVFSRFSSLKLSASRRGRDAM